MNKLPIRLLAGVLLTLGMFVFQGRAAVYTVTNTNDTGSGSLRAAILSANQNNDDDTINFDPAFFSVARTINLTSGTLQISNPVTITGTGARILTLQRTAGTFSIFTISSFAVSVSGMTVTGGNNSGIIVGTNANATLDGLNISGNTGGGGGGGISTNGTLRILNSLISSNTAADFGAGISVTGGTLTVANSTITNNMLTGAGSLDSGAGIDNFGTTTSLNNVTIANNTNNNNNPSATGGIYNFSGTVNIRNTIVAENSAPNTANKDVSGAFASNGNNLVQITTGSTGFSSGIGDRSGQAGLGALADNGGQTDTLAPLFGSPAINGGNNCVVSQACGVNNPPVALTSDQRKSPYTRISNGQVDIGAFEVQAAPTAAGTAAGGRITESNGRGIFRVLVTITDSQGNQRQTYTNQLGYYNFSDVPGGQVYVFTAFHRRYEFDQPTQVQFIGEEQDGINFIGSPSGLFRSDIWNLPTKKIE